MCLPLPLAFKWQRNGIFIHSASCVFSWTMRGWKCIQKYFIIAFNWNYHQFFFWYAFGTRSYSAFIFSCQVSWKKENKHISWKAFLFRREKISRWKVFRISFSSPHKATTTSPERSEKLIKKLSHTHVMTKWNLNLLITHVSRYLSSVDEIFRGWVNAQMEIWKLFRVVSRAYSFIGQLFAVSMPFPTPIEWEQSE